MDAFSNDNMKPHATAGEPSLLTSDDHPAARRINAGGAGPFVLTCDHASNKVPRALGDLGLSDEHFDRHIAFDIGAEGVTRRLSNAMDAPAVVAGYSRLVVDLNRPRSIPPAPRDRPPR